MAAAVIMRNLNVASPFPGAMNPHLHLQLVYFEELLTLLKSSKALSELYWVMRI